MRGFQIRRAALLGATLVLLAGIASATPTEARGIAPPTGNIRAFLNPPHTFYTADLTDPDGNDLTYDWSGTQIGCGSWQEEVTGGPETADWYHGGAVGNLSHPSNPPVECSHTGGTNSSNHPGTFVVRVKDGTGGDVTCTYTGPQTGEGPPCSSEYDLAVDIEGDISTTEGKSTNVFVKVSNLGPAWADGVRVSIPHVQKQTNPFAVILAGGYVWDPSIGGSYIDEVGSIAPGAHAFVLMDLVAFEGGVLEATVNADNPPGKNPANQTDTAGINVVKGKCTQKASAPLRSPNDDDGVKVGNKSGAQVVCTKGGDDRITAGDGDIVYSKGGDDNVNSKQNYAALILGGGNDKAKCAGSCYVDGGPGKDNCPEGAGIIRKSCEK